MDARPFAHEIIRYDDEQLDRYLEENDRVVSVRDPDNVPESFFQRLRDRNDVEGPPGAAAARPVDFNELSAKLANVLTRTGRRRISTPPSDVSVDPEDLLERRIQQEEDAYEELVRQGGRPLYHIDQLRDIAASPETYTDLWLPFHWLIKNPDPRASWDVFTWQLREWHYFQEESQDARKTTQTLATLNEEAQKRRLLVGLTKTFTFAMDMSLQDTLTTWAEYLDCLCRMYVQYGYSLEHFQQQRSQTPARYLNWILDQFALIEKETTQQNLKSDADNSGSGKDKDKKADSNSSRNNGTTPPITNTAHFASALSSSSRRKRKRDESGDKPGGEGDLTGATLIGKDEPSISFTAKRRRSSRAPHASTSPSAAAAAASPSTLMPASPVATAPDAVCLPHAAETNLAPSAAFQRRKNKHLTTDTSAVVPRRSLRTSKAEEKKAQEADVTAAPRTNAVAATSVGNAGKASSGRSQQTRKPEVTEKAQKRDKKTSRVSKPPTRIQPHRERRPPDRLGEWIS